MKRLCSVLFVTVFVFAAAAQGGCNFIQDTVFVPKENKVITADCIKASLKNKSQIILYKAASNKYYLKLIVTENLYFNKVDMLEIRSGTKSFYAKETKNFEYDKHAGFYVVEIYKNYAGTLKDEGITSIVFGKAETSFSKQDCNQIKQISKCFYESIAAKK
jgi:hypothetical protein